MAGINLPQGRSTENVILVAEMRDLEMYLTALVGRFQAICGRFAALVRARSSRP
jgi:hypothetical protein